MSTWKPPSLGTSLHIYTSRIHSEQWIEVLIHTQPTTRKCSEPDRYTPQKFLHHTQRPPLPGTTQNTSRANRGRKTREKLKTRHDTILQDQDKLGILRYHPVIIPRHIPRTLKENHYRRGSSLSLPIPTTPKRRLSFLRHHVCYPSHPPLHHRLVTGCV